MKRRTAVAASLVLAAALAPAQAAEGWRFAATGDLVHDDNATRGLYDGKKADNLLAVEGSATRSAMLGPQSGALFRLAARYTHYVDISDISNLALIGRAAWRYQPSPGFSAPWVELAGQGQLLRHADSELRDGNILSFDASVGSYLTDRARVSAGLGVDERSGGGSAPLYDLTNDRLWGTLDLRVGVSSAVYSRVTRLSGDQVFSSGSVSGLSGTWADDPALRGPLGLAVANVYRVEATTFIYELGFNLPFGPGRALDFSVIRSDSKITEGPYDGQKYSATQLRASVLYRFQ